jgi:hypothetical protein
MIVPRWIGGRESLRTVPAGWGADMPCPRAEAWGGRDGCFIIIGEPVEGESWDLVPVEQWVTKDRHLRFRPGLRVKIILPGGDMPAVAF